MTADYLMEVLRNTNQVQLPHQALWLAQESFLSTLKKTQYNQRGIKLREILLELEQREMSVL